MIEKIVYKCEVCGKEYEDEKRCKKCEKCHKTDFKIINVKFNGWETDDSYPWEIEVEFSNGHHEWFRRF